MVPKPVSLKLLVLGLSVLLAQGGRLGRQKTPGKSRRACFVRPIPRGGSRSATGADVWDQEQDRRKPREAGFYHPLTEPVDPGQLVKLMADALEKSRLKGSP